MQSTDGPDNMKLKV